MQVLKYSEENLCSALSNKYTSKHAVSCKFHFQYLKKYLREGLKTSSIVLEEGYISKDFLEDYTSYYAQCFEAYPKVCKRVHFFDLEFSEADFGSALLNSDYKPEIWDSYLGFIVVKPIPSKIIGYTVLRTYTEGEGEDLQLRNFWGTRDYPIHLFGKELYIKSLAFQEQDSVLAACATTAVWSMLNKASINHHTILKSPSQITRDADRMSSDGSRLFPNKGLSILQICQSILNSGLVCEVKQPDIYVLDKEGKRIGTCVSKTYLNKIVNAYSPIGIPIILGISVPNGGQHALHAIAVSGFKQITPSFEPPKKEISWLANNIEKFYAHDDQWGPFARLLFNNEQDLETPWTEIDEWKRPSRVTNIVLPLYPKIRISYEDIEAAVLGLDRILTLFFGEKTIADLVWDIKIRYSQDFKADIRKSTLPNEQRLNLIKESMPKYVWQATCYIAGVKVFDFTFDATDVTHGMIGRNVLVYIEEVIPTLKSFLIKNKTVLVPLFHKSPAEEYYDFLLFQLD